MAASNGMALPPAPAFLSCTKRGGPTPASRPQNAPRRGSGGAWFQRRGDSVRSCGCCPSRSRTVPRQGPDDRSRRRAAPEGTALMFQNARALENAHVIFVADEPHLLHVGLLGDGENLVDDLIAGRGIGLEVKFRDRVHLLRR